VGFATGTVFISFVQFQRAASATCQSPCRRGCRGLPWNRKYLTGPYRSVPFLYSNYYYYGFSQFVIK